ncbi:hypothetical protein NKH95_16925 [Mesorhizobium sp. M0848]|uniref:hypothetical protein n=1 Tax=Mesorhizobium sp. M0848 TaxID=2957012 RepID=UPI003338EC41
MVHQDLPAEVSGRIWPATEKASDARQGGAGSRQAVDRCTSQALNAVCVYRCTTMEELRTKAEFLKEFATGKYGDVQPEDVDALLWSFLPEEALEDAVKASEGGAA